jgi:predicted membrane-bound spermidine synthase
LNLPLVNRGFVYGCAAAVLFILGKVAKFGASAASNEWVIYILVILTGGFVGALLCLCGRMLLHRGRRENRCKDDN